MESQEETSSEAKGYKTPTKGYGKRPMWQWVLLYLVVAGVVYYIVYYFFFAKSGGY